MFFFWGGGGLISVKDLPGKYLPGESLPLLYVNHHNFSEIFNSIFANLKKKVRSKRKKT